MLPLLAAAGISAAGSILGSVLGRQKAPQQATYTPVDPNSVAASTIAGNLGNLKQAESLASQTNSFNQSQANQLLEQAMPGFGALQKRLLGQVNQDLSSQYGLPQEMKDQIARYAAEKGVSRGTSGNFNGFSLVKDFGFNLVDWQNAQRARALNTLSTVFGMTPRVNPMSPMASLVDTNAALGVQTQNNQMQFNATQAGYNAQAAANNYNRMVISSAVMNAANFAGSAMLQGAGMQPKSGNAPMPSASMAPGTSPLAKGPSYASAKFPISYGPTR